MWIQAVGDQLLIGVDVEEGDTEYANLLLRPQATNLVGLQLEMEPADLAGDDEVIMCTVPTAITEPDRGNPMLALGKLLELTLAGREPTEKIQLTARGRAPALAGRGRAGSDAHRAG